jgi:hypothetical protein
VVGSWGLVREATEKALLDNRLKWLALLPIPTDSRYNFGSMPT